MALGNVDQHLRDPGVVGLHQPERPHVVVAMGVKPGRDEQHLRTEVLQCREPFPFHGSAKRAPWAVGGERHVDWRTRVRFIHPLASLQAASCTYRIALGPRAGQKVLSLRAVAGQDEKLRKVLCANAHGFSLHAAVRCEADQRIGHIYITRPTLANERLSRNGKGQVALKLKSPYRDGTTHIVMQPQEFMQRLAALVPRPRLHLIRFHGVLAPHAKLREAVVPQPAQKDSAPAHEHAHGQAARMSWARLPKRVFDIDVERCACGGQLKTSSRSRSRWWS